MALRFTIFWTILSCFLLGCSGQTGTSAGSLTVTPSTIAEIRIVEETSDGFVTRVISSEDESFTPLYAEWRALLDNVTGRARTFFSQARFEQEIVSAQRIEALFKPPYPTITADRSTQTDHVIFVYVGDDPLLLAKMGNEWSAFLVEQEAIIAFVEATAQIDGLSLLPDPSP